VKCVNHRGTEAQRTNKVGVSVEDKIFEPKIPLCVNSVALWWKKVVEKRSKT
jgi:hypothetical protein